MRLSISIDGGDELAHDVVHSRVGLCSHQDGPCWAPLATLLAHGPQQQLYYGVCLRANITVCYVEGWLLVSNSRSSLPSVHQPVLNGHGGDNIQGKLNRLCLWASKAYDSCQNCQSGCEGSDAQLKDEQAAHSSCMMGVQ